MALVLSDRTADTTISIVSPFTVSGAAPTGFQTFGTGVGDTNTTYCTITDNVGNWVDLLATYAASTLTLTTVSIISSSTGALTLPAFVTGYAKQIFCTLPASKTLYKDANNTVTVAGRLINNTAGVWNYTLSSSIAAVTTLTQAQLQGGVLAISGSTYTITMPTATVLDGFWPDVAANTAIGVDLYFVSTAIGVITIGAAAGVTIVGGTTPAPTTIAIGVSAHFKLVRTAAATYIMYRIG